MAEPGRKATIRWWRGPHAATLDVGQVWFAVGWLTRPRLGVYRYRSRTAPGGGVRFGCWYLDIGWTATPPGEST